MSMLLFYLLFTIKSIVGDPHCEYFDSNGNCYKCEENYGVLKDKGSKYNGWCVKCFDAYCKTCNDDAYICEECELNYTLDKKQGSSTYKKCVSCPPNCEYCSLDECRLCKEGFGFGPNHECIKCESPFCNICYQDYKKCESCALNYGIEGGICYHCIIDKCENCQTQIRDCKRCEEGFVYNAQSSKCYKCEERYPNCERCQNNACRYCKEGFYLLDKGGCGACHEDCIDCNRYTGECLHCRINYVLINGRCELCTKYDPNCERCHIDDYGDVRCHVCKEGQIVNYDGKCTKSTIENCNELNEDGTCKYCKEDYGHDDNLICSKCPEGCLTCYKDHTKCDSFYCENGYEYDFENYKCSKCPDNCGKCEKQPKCIECNEGYGVNENGLCSPCTIQNCTSCGKNYKTCEICDVFLIYDPIKNICSTNCSDSNCLKCELINGTICKECANGSYLLENQCIKCSDPNCINCDNDVCEKCKDGYVIQNGKCIKCLVENCFNCYGSSEIVCGVCMPGFGVVNNLCVPCADKNCADCSNGVGNCRSCWPGFGLHLINGSSDYGKCLSCDVENCTKCDGHVFICTECIEDYYLINNKCEDSPNTEDSIYHEDEEEFFPTWAIVVIVVVGVIVIGVVIFLIVYCCKKKKVKVDADSSSI